MHNLKNFKRLHSQGFRTKWIQDQFVTKTFPNHWTIATGLYEESHGIVSNKFFAPELDKEFNAFARPAWKSWNPKFWKGEPIWKTNEKQGGKSGSFYWVGSEVPVMRPSYWEKYNVSYPWNDRVDKVINWLGEEEVNFATLYIDEPDHHGHMYGPSSVEVGEVLQKCDQTLGYLIDSLPENINLIVTSDHGMEDLDKNHLILIEDFVPRTEYDRWYGEVTHAGIWANETQLAKIKNQLLELKKTTPNGEHLNIWYREEIPERFHLKNSQHVPPLLLVADEPYQVVRTTREARLKGEHGYDNRNMNMHPIFMGRGPVFKKESKKLEEPFDSVDIYPLMCHILGVEPAPNNGSLCEVSHLLKVKPNECAFL